MKKAIGILFLSLGVCFVASQAKAATVNLTTAGSSGTINGAIFQQINPKATGTGNIDSFVEVGSNHNIIQAYNTTVNNVFDNGSSDQFNHALLLSDVPVVNLNGTDYRQFLLDINQQASHPLESLDAIQIFQSGTANQSVTTFNSGILGLADSTLVYNMNAGGTNEILLNYSLNSGSGSGDMFAYIPNSDFTSSDKYVYLYSKFGVEDPNNAGFEEWAVLQPKNTDVVPEPATMALMTTGLMGFGLLRRRMLI